MPKVTPARDDSLAEKGYVRASIVAVVLKLSVSTIVKWVKHKEIDHVQMSGMCWVNWAALRQHVNTYTNQAREGVAEIEQLPKSAIEVLKKARSEILKAKKAA